MSIGTGVALRTATGRGSVAPDGAVSRNEVRPEGIAARSTGGSLPETNNARPCAAEPQSWQIPTWSREHLVRAPTRRELCLGQRFLHWLSCRTRISHEQRADRDDRDSGRDEKSPS